MDTHNECTWVFHNAPFDLEVITRATGYDFDTLVRSQRLWDTGILYQLIHLARRGRIPRWSLEATVLEYLGVRLQKDDSLRKGFGSYINSDGFIDYFDPTPAYIAQIERLIDLEPLRQAGLTVLIDAMWGNGAGWFTRLLEGGTTRIIEIHDQRNPIFPEMSRPEPIPPNINVGLTAISETGADILIITDGDADRVGAGDENGKFIDQLRVYGLLAFFTP